MLRSAIVAAGLAALAFHPSLRADIIAYAVDNGENLYSVDLSTATSTLIGSTGEFLEGLALSPGGTLFATDGNGHLYTVNKATGASTLVGSTGLGDIEGLTFDGSTLLGTDFNDPTTIYSINTTNANVTSLVSANAGVVRAMSLLDSNDVYVTSDSPVFQSLETINLTTGSTTDIGAFSDSNLIAALVYNGVLYALDSAGNEYTINRANADLTLVGNTGGQFYLDATLASVAPVPEPASILLLFGVIGAVGMKLRRKLT
jgi:hypothetical protein